MKRRTFLSAGGGAILSAGAGFAPVAAFAQSDENALPVVAEMVMGNPDATVEVIEYASYTCPHCANFHANQYKLLKANYIDTGKIRFIYREVYFDRPGLWASMIARCPETTEFFFAFSELLYQEQRNWLASGDPATIVQELRRLAKTAGLDDEMLDKCLTDGPKAQALFTWYQANPERDGINSTPSFMIDGSPYSNMAYDEFADLLDRRLG